MVLMRAERHAGPIARWRAWALPIHSFIHSVIKSLIKTDKALLHNKNDSNSMKRYKNNPGY